MVARRASTVVRSRRYSEYNDHQNSIHLELHLPLLIWELVLGQVLWLTRQNFPVNPILHHHVSNFTITLGPNVSPSGWNNLCGRFQCQHNRQNAENAVVCSYKESPSLIRKQRRVGASRLVGSGGSGFHILVPRGRNPFGQHQGSGPLAGAKTRRPWTTDSLSNLANLIGWKSKKSILHMLKKSSPARNLDPWCWPINQSINQSIVYLPT